MSMEPTVALLSSPSATASAAATSVPTTNADDSLASAVGLLHFKAQSQLVAALEKRPTKAPALVTTPPLASTWAATPGTSLPLPPSVSAKARPRAGSAANDEARAAAEAEAEERALVAMLPEEVDVSSISAHSKSRSRRTSSSSSSTTTEDGVFNNGDGSAVISADGSDAGNAPKLSLTERLERDRAERHGAALQELHYVLGTLRDRLQQRIIMLMEQARNRLDEDGAELTALLTHLRRDLAVRVDSARISHALSAIAEHRSRRIAIIQQLYDALLEIEIERRKGAGEALRDAGKVLRAIGLLLPPGVNDVIYAEALGINRTLIENRRAIADLKARLLTAEVAFEAEHTASWRTLAESWALASRKRQTETFNAAVTQISAATHQAQMDELELLRRERASASARAGKELSSAAQLVPPRVSERVVHDWHTNITHLLSAANFAVESRSAALLDAAEAAHSEGDARLNALLRGLVDSGVCGTDEAREFVSSAPLGAITRVREIATAVVEPLTAACERVASDNASNCASLRKLVSHVASLWTRHEDRLAACQEACINDVNAERANCEAVREDVERRIDVAVDQLRHATADGLTGALSAIRADIGHEEEAYVAFSRSAMTRIEAYPVKARTLHDSFERELFEILSATPIAVSKAKTKGAKGTAATESEETEEVEAMAEEGEVHENDKTPLIVVDDSIAFSLAPVTSLLSLTPVTESAVSSGASSETLESALADAATAAANAGRIEQSAFSAAAAEFRRAVLCIAIELREAASDVASLFVAETCGEVSAEVEGSLAVLHERIDRIKFDVHNVRAAELVLHRDRVTRHSAGISETLDRQLSGISIFKEGRESRLEDLAVRIKALTTQLPSLRSSRLQEQQSERVESLRISFEQNLRLELQGFRQKLTDGLKGLLQANGAFRASFRTFTEQGNFCAEEIAEYKDILVALAQKIDDAEGVVLAHLDGMEASHVSRCRELQSAFDTELAICSRDMTFVEAIRKELGRAKILVHSEVSKSNVDFGKLAAANDRLVLLTQEKAKAPALEDLLGSINALARACRQRALYLDCLRPNSAAAATSSQTVAATASSGRGGSSSGDNALLRSSPSAPQRSVLSLKNMKVSVKVYAQHPAGSFRARVTSYLSACRQTALERAQQLYSQGSMRNNRQPEWIKDTLQAFSDSIQQRLDTLEEQAISFQRASSAELMELVATVDVVLPRAVTNSMHSQLIYALNALEAARRSNQETLVTELAPLEAKAKEYRARLGPRLAHPAARAALTEIDAAESARSRRVMDVLDGSAVAIAASENRAISATVTAFTSTATTLLGAMDTSVVASDLVVLGREPPEPLLVDALAAQRNTTSGAPKGDKAYVPQTQQRCVTRPELRIEELGANAVLPAVETGSSAAHDATIAARDDCFRRFASRVLEIRSSQHEFIARRRQDEVQSRLVWAKLVGKLGNLYAPMPTGSESLQSSE